MDMNYVARLVTLEEGMREQVSIANVKEVLRVLRDLCHKDAECWFTISDYLRYSKRDCLRKRGRPAKRPRVNK